MNNFDQVQGVKVLGSSGDLGAEILPPEALKFVADLE